MESIINFLLFKEMLSKFKVQHYKSLFDTEIELEPLTVFIGPNGSGKSNICEALALASNFLHRLIFPFPNTSVISYFDQSLASISRNEQHIVSKFWQGKLDWIRFKASTFLNGEYLDDNFSKNSLNLLIDLNYYQQRINIEYNNDTITIDKIDQIIQTNNDKLLSFIKKSKYNDSSLLSSLTKIVVYDFAPTDLSNKGTSISNLDKTGQGIANTLVDILHNNRKKFDELEERFTRLIPNIQRITLPRGENKTFLLELVDKYSEHNIPATDVSDGTLRILGFLTALYQKETPSIICFEELENGVHPWLLHKMMELLKTVSTEGINDKPVQVLITTHSPLLLNYVEPYQVRAVELDGEGKTQVHKLPIDSVRFQKALEAYDGELGELWFTNVFGGNPT